MTLPAPSPDRPSASSAAWRFIRALEAEAMLGRAARVEATLCAGDEASLFAFDRLLKRLWPQALGAPPSHEIIWAKGPAGLKLAAFDAEGRLLLRQAYEVAFDGAEVIRAGA